ncbi:hypothetical protein T484DRAFT_1974581, partial [Baffinella frigidus]
MCLCTATFCTAWGKSRHIHLSLSLWLAFRGRAALQHLCKATLADAPHLIPTQFLSPCGVFVIEAPKLQPWDTMSLIKADLWFGV